MEIQYTHDPAIRKRAEAQTVWRRLSTRRQVMDVSARSVMSVICAATCLLVVVVALALYSRSRPLLDAYSLSDLLTGTVWQPMRGRVWLCARSSPAASR